MRFHWVFVLCCFSLSVFANEKFTIVSKSKYRIDGEIYQGNCEEISKQAIKPAPSMFGNCRKQGAVTLDSKMPTFTIDEGQWGIFFKTTWGSGGFLPAVCRAQKPEDGKYLWIETRKLAKKIAGKSFGFGLTCTQHKTRD